MSEELAIELFNLAIEEEQQHARNEGLDKIDMMPVKSEWENMGGEDKDYWREHAKKVETIFNKLGYRPKPKLTLISDEEILRTWKASKASLINSEGKNNFEYEIPSNTWLTKLFSRIKGIEIKFHPPESGISNIIFPKMKLFPLKVMVTSPLECSQ